MEVAEKMTVTKDYLTKSNLPASDYVINPYVGCTHSCKYCYASFMKRFTGHQEEWGTFIDIKQCEKPININKVKGKTVFFSSVTDCYNKFEEKYKITRTILEQLVNADCQITISTKSDLILRDIELLKKMKQLKVALSINTLDEKFRANMDKGSTIDRRIESLKILHREGIYTVLFMSPIFPYITEYEEIIKQTKEFVNEYWFENLNLRGSYKKTIMDYIRDQYPQLEDEYIEIYNNKNQDYWKELAKELDAIGNREQVKYINYFYHDELVKSKKDSRKKD